MRRCHFTADDSGTVSVLFAVLATVLLAMAGAGLDLARVYRTQSDYQNALDFSTLASLAAGSDQDAAERFKSYLSAKGINSKRATFSRAISGNDVIASGRHSVTVHTPLLSLIGFKQFEANVMSEAAAPMLPDTIELKVNQAYGWSNKDVQFWVQRPNGVKENIATLQYVMTDRTGAAWRGTGITTILPSTNIDIGEFTSLWVEMKVESDTESTATYSTQDPATSDHVFVDGKQMPLGKSVLISSLIPCNSKVEHSMEDTPTGSGAVNWENQDIFYDVTTTCSGARTGMSHLTK